MKKLLKGNIALAEGAVLAGCTHYFGYPITPQNEIPEYMSKRLPEAKGVFVQSESETAAINMVFGAAAAGARVMTTTSSPGFSLMQEGVSYLCAARLPCVLANVQRGGPGLGNIAPSQADYFQAVKGGGHGDYRMLTLAPASPQEMMDMTILAFELSEKYMMPSLILSDGAIGQMMETVDIPHDVKLPEPDRSYALNGCEGRDSRIVRTLWLDADGVPKNNKILQQIYQDAQKEVRFETWQTDDAEVILVAYGLSARIARTAIFTMRENGLKVGMFRPQTLWPFPSEALQKLSADGKKAFMVIEMSAGQFVDDVKREIGSSKLMFYGTPGGDIPQEGEIIKRVKDHLDGKK